MFTDFYRILPIFRTFLGDFSHQQLPLRRLWGLWEWKNRALLEEYYVFNVVIPLEHSPAVIISWVHYYLRSVSRTSGTLLLPRFSGPPRGSQEDFLGRELSLHKEKRLNGDGPDLRVSRLCRSSLHRETTTQQ